jgi:hypothetical protein
LIPNTAINFHNLFNEIFEHNRYLTHLIKNPDETNLFGDWQPWDKNGEPVPYYWNTLHARAHVVGADEDDKIRAVFGATKLLLMVENMFIWQLQRIYLNEDKGRLLWGREMMKGGWKRIWKEMFEEKRGNGYLSIDWSQWDKRLPFELMDVVHDIWRSYFDFNFYAPTSFYPNATPSQGEESIENLWKWMCYSIKHTPILLPNGELYKWNHSGFGSGYQQTQLMDSFGDAIEILTCLSAMGINIESPAFWYRIQGDDSLIKFLEQMFAIYGPNFLDMLAQCALHYFNAKLNVKKSQFRKHLNDISVLGYFNRFGIPYRTDEDLLRHLYFPEYPQDLGKLAATAIGLASASCGCSERFLSVCRDILRRVKKREFTIQYNALEWMVRAGMIESIDQLINVEIPDRLDLLSNAWTPTYRNETQRQKLWPTRPGSRGRFYFIEPPLA